MNGFIEKNYYNCDIIVRNKVVRDKKFMQTVTQNVSYGRLASYRVKGFFPMLAAAILNES